MALWPLVAPLANSEGEVDGAVAKHVIIACNSASVRKEGAIGLIECFCQDVKKRRDSYAHGRPV